MRRWTPILLLTGAIVLRAEIIDRIAVTVDGLVITQSDILNQIRVAAFLNGETPTATPEVRRETAQRLVEQVLTRREMEISRYPTPEPEEIEPMLAQLEKQAGGEAQFGKALAEAGISESELREGLFARLTMMRFLEYRFRPGITVTDEEVEEYYRITLAPSARAIGEEPPDVEDSRESIEEILIQQRVNEAVYRWLEQAARASRILYREEAFQ